MCDYCKEDKIIMEKEVIHRSTWGWGCDTLVKENNAVYYQLGIFIDRGYLRYVDLEDCNCLEHGCRVKINFCPFCGNKLE